jgi:ferredoxin
MTDNSLIFFGMGVSTDSRNQKKSDDTVLLTAICNSAQEEIMALFITDDCINCGHCVRECPNTAIYEPGSTWTMQEGTGLKGTLRLMNNRYVQADDMMEPLSEKYYFIVPDKCTECKGVFEEPQCLVVCPDPESIIHHPWYPETENELLARQFQFSH